MESISWKLIDKYFKDNPYNLVAHHLESYDDFFKVGIHNIFRENNPIRFIEREEKEGDNTNQALLYLGGKNGEKLYFGKPVIYDENYSHYMYPNDARLRNMTYGITIHYDVDVDFIYYEDGLKKEHSITLEKIYLGRFPIMLHSKLCILKDMAREARFNVGECRHDYGGYFIIDGKEKVIVSQEKFADNMLYVRKNKEDNIYSHSAEIRSVSEDASKPIRTMGVKMIAGPANIGKKMYSNEQIVVTVPNVRKPVPLFILMRALGLSSDKQIIEYCLLDLEKNEEYVDLFIPSIHDAAKIFNQRVALEYIATLTKRGTISGVMEILMNYLLPHIGENNFLDKAYFIGYMVNKLLRVFTGEEKPTDRDNFKFKRVELTGSLIYDLFREYYLIQKRAISLKVDEEHYYHRGQYKGAGFLGLIGNNYREFFKEREVESGFKKAFKGNWGSEAHTKRVGVIQDVNRLSWNSFISQLRKFNLPLDSSAKVVGPRLLHSSQWGYIDPVDTPDGGNIGLHKHMSISTIVTSGSSSKSMIKWLRSKTTMKLLQECNSVFLSSATKIIVNGAWIGVVDNPIETVSMIRMFRRNGIIPPYISISFHYNSNEINIYTDAGRLTRPVYYIEEKKASFQRKEIEDLLELGNFTWENVVTGFNKKSDKEYSIKKHKIYNIEDLYPEFKSLESIEHNFSKNKSLIDYVDTSEEEGLLIAMKEDDVKKNKYYTHIEIHPSLILGVLGNMVIYPENNQFPRNAFSCGQSKQAVSTYHSNYQMRMDKMGVILNYGQVPLVKSRYLHYINKEEMPYGINTIVAIMSYTGYNVEDAILINEGAIRRGLFNTTYHSMYEAREESSKVAGSTSSSKFEDVAGKNVTGTKPGYDYSHLDKWGLVKENTQLDDSIVMIGKVTSSALGETSGAAIDSSVFPKKGQLGYVDKTFITEGEEGFRLAKVRVREERIPAIGDKMASRCGQKGTIGLIVPEEDMPFTKDGLKPDLIINPHAIPSRMTIGQLVESLLGIICLEYGGFGDSTAFVNNGPNTDVYGRLLVKSGFHASGNHVMYNGMTGEQIYSEIYMGPTYYMRLKHMVKDKINYRARGPNTMLTRQSVQGRANDGGLRIGEMERDGIMAHGASAFLNESFMVRGDEYYMAVCNKTGCMAIYNSALNLFVSPLADGPLQFNTTLDGKMNVRNITRFGRSFSIVRIPYALKLLIQELQVMNIQMRIITDENVDQLMNMSYSDNINKLLDDDRDVEEVIKTLKMNNAGKLRKENEKEKEREKIKIPRMKTPVVEPEAEYPRDVSPAYEPSSQESEVYSKGSEVYRPGSISNPLEKRFSPSSPDEPPPQEKLSGPSSPDEPPPWMVNQPSEINIKNPEMKTQYDALPERDKELLLKMVNKMKYEKAEKEKAKEKADEEAVTAILEIDKKDEEGVKNEDGNEGEGENAKKDGEQSGGGKSGGGQSGGNSSVKKIVTFS